MKKLILYLWLALTLVGCGSSGPPDTESFINVETEDYFLFEWKFWEQSEDSDLIWKLEGEVENISDKRLLDAQLKAKFYDAEDNLIDEMTFDLFDFFSGFKKDFILSTQFHPATFSRGEIRVYFDLEGIKNPHKSDPPEILFTEDFFLEPDKNEEV